MIVNGGKIELENAQRIYLGGLSWGLYTDPGIVTDATVMGDLTECTFAGYGRVGVGAVPVPTLIGGKALAPTTLVTWTNTGAIDTTFKGVFLVNPFGEKLIFVNPVGPITLHPGETYSVAPIVTLTHP